jgi:hypothetical protein
VKKIFSSAVERAGEKAAEELSEQLSNNAISAGWPADAANSLTVKFNGGNFEMFRSPEHSTVVFDMEFGTESRKGTATIRKTLSSTKETADRFASLYVEELMQ